MAALEISARASGDNKILKAAEKAALDEIKRHVIIKIRRNAVEKGFKQAISEIIAFNEDGLASTLLNELDDNLEEDTWGKLSGQETVGLFVTFSPEPETCQLHQLLKEMEYYLKPRKGIKQAMFCIEQNGGPGTSQPLGYHPHAHLLIWLDKDCQQGERGKQRVAITRRLSKYKTKSPAYLDIKAVKLQNMSKKMLYIQGVKNEEKMKAVENDKVWRAMNSLQDCYGTAT